MNHQHLLQTNFGNIVETDEIKIAIANLVSFKKDEIELLRMCTKLNIQVIGGFSKLIKHQPYDTFISYVDRSKFDGHGYNKIGFIVISNTGPSYKYYKCGIELNRIATQKHKLSKLLGDKFNPNETETQNMIRCGWLHVCDCGNLKVIYKKYSYSNV